MVNRIADNLPPPDPPPDSWYEEPEDDDEDDDDDDYGDDGDDWACATTRELNEVSDDLDTHLKDYAGLRERVSAVEGLLNWLKFVLLVVLVVLFLHIMASR